MLNFKDIAKIFEEIELRLISSLKRNITRHKQEEQQYGFDWSAWQAEKLRNIDKFRQENSRIMSDYTTVIDNATRQIMLDEFSQGMNGVKALKADEPHFFGVDDTKINKLIDDVVNLEKHAETAALRTMDDVYRQTVNKAQLAMSTGSMTLQQAIDMSVQDFLNKGINCIVYRNGRRVNIADYVRMALRTTATRANLYGMSAKIRQLGYDTVLVSSYGMCSETCLPWQGRPYIDDVFSMWNGEIQERSNGELWGKSHYCEKWFPLLSTALHGGLFHPNCRHTITMWRDGDPLPEPQDNSEIQRRYRLERQQRQLENKVRKAKRFVAGQADPNNLKEAKKLLHDAQKELREFIANTNLSEGATILKRDYGKEKIYTTVNSQNGLTSVSNNVKIEDIASGISVKTKYFDGELKYYDITDERINKIKPVKLETLSDKNNQKLTTACKDLLSYMKGEKLGKEGLIAFDMNMNEIIRYKATGKTASVGLPDLSEDCIIIHNHPSGLLFSPKDYEQFSNVDSIRIFGAVGNDGSIYFIEKTDDFDNMQYDFDYFQLQHKYGYFDNEDKHHFNSDIEKLLFSEEFIDGGKNSGFKAYISANK